MAMADSRGKGAKAESHQREIANLRAELKSARERIQFLEERIAASHDCIFAAPKPVTVAK